MTPEQIKELKAKLRYMGRQYASGQQARGVIGSKHYLEESADAIEFLIAENDKLHLALDKLARLGNEPHYGNSSGNCFALTALGEKHD